MDFGFKVGGGVTMGFKPGGSVTFGFDVGGGSPEPTPEPVNACVYGTAGTIFGPTGQLATSAIYGTATREE